MQLDEYTAGKRNHKYMKKVGIVACSDVQKEEYRWWCLLQIGKRYQPRHWKPQLRFLSSSMYVSLLMASSFFWLPGIRKYENQDTNWRASIMVSSIGFAHIQLRNRENRRQGHWWFCEGRWSISSSKSSTGEKGKEWWLLGNIRHFRDDGDFFGRWRINCCLAIWQILID